MPSRRRCATTFTAARAPFSLLIEGEIDRIRTRVSMKSQDRHKSRPLKDARLI
jgi:hypothetical protein